MIILRVIFVATAIYFLDPLLYISIGIASTVFIVFTKYSSWKKEIEIKIREQESDSTHIDAAITMSLVLTVVLNIFFIVCLWPSLMLRMLEEGFVKTAE
jgi:hypothetical protein